MVVRQSSSNNFDDEAFTTQVNLRKHLNNENQFVTYFDKQLLFYNAEELTRFKSFRYWKGTVLTDSSLWNKLGMMMLICSFTAGVTEMRFGPEVKELDTMYMDDILMQLNALTAFLLGFYLQEVIRRWWKVRSESIDNFQQAVSNLLQLASESLSGSLEDQKIRALITRYALLAHQFVFHERDETAEQEKKHLNSLRAMGLLTDDEVLLLRRNVHKSHIAWTWMFSLFHYLIWKKEKIPKELVKNVHDQLYHGRKAIQRGESFVNTQIPLPYVHLNALCVHIFHILLSGISGVNICISVHTSNYGRLSLAMSMIWAFGLLYQSILIIAARLSNPLGRNETNFPRLAYHVNLQEQLEAASLASSAQHQEFFWPPALLKKVHKKKNGIQVSE